MTVLTWMIVLLKVFIIVIGAGSITMQKNFPTLCTKMQRKNGIICSLKRSVKSITQPRVKDSITLLTWVTNWCDWLETGNREKLLTGYCQHTLTQTHTYMFICTHISNKNGLYYRNKKLTINQISLFHCILIGVYSPELRPHFHYGILTDSLFFTITAYERSC